MKPERPYRTTIDEDVAAAVAAMAGIADPRVDMRTYIHQLLRGALLAGDRGKFLRAIHKAPADVPAAFAETFGEPADQDVAS